MLAHPLAWPWMEDLASGPPSLYLALLSFAEAQPYYLHLPRKSCSKRLSARTYAIMSVEKQPVLSFEFSTASTEVPPKHLSLLEPSVLTSDSFMDPITLHGELILLVKKQWHSLQAEQLVTTRCLQICWRYQKKAHRQSYVWGLSQAQWPNVRHFRCSYAFLSFSVFFSSFTQGTP